MDINCKNAVIIVSKTIVCIVLICAISMIIFWGCNSKSVSVPVQDIVILSQGIIDKETLKIEFRVQNHHSGLRYLVNRKESGRIDITIFESNDTGQRVIHTKKGSLCIVVDSLYRRSDHVRVYINNDLDLGGWEPAMSGQSAREKVNSKFSD